MATTTSNSYIWGNPAPLKTKEEKPISIRILAREKEGYTKEILGPIFGLINECGFKVVFTHSFLTTENGEELMGSTLLASEYAPIQPNAMYFICRFEKPEGQRPNRFIDELMDDHSEGTFGSLFLEMGKFSHHRDWLLPWDASIRKNIMFYDSSTQESIGWYNKNLNILWMGDIGNFPETAASNIEKVLSGVMKYKRTGRLPIIKVTIGTDPEFEVLSPKGELINADTLFCDPQKNKPIGVDGHAATGEIRPPYATNPLRLARNIKRLIRGINNNPNINTTTLVCAGGGTKVATGGHIHFGITKMPEELREHLWKLVAAPVLKYQGKLRSGDGSKCKKGGEDVIRTPHWGQGIEWRPLPSFIINEEITTAVLCTAYAVVKSYFNGGISTTSGKAAYTRLPLYPQYREYIDTFTDIFVKSETSLVLENRDILREWRLAKLNKKPTVIVRCSDQNLEKFFTPLYIKLNDVVRILIQFGPDQYLGTFGVPQEVASDFRKFARRHFIDYIETANMPEGRPFTGNDMVIFLPVFWNPKDLDIARDMFEELKDVIKDAIIAFDRMR